MEEIINILQKQLRNESLTQQESKRFSLWIAVPGNRAAFEDYIKLWNITEVKAQVLKPDVDVQWKKFMHSRNALAKKSLRMPIRYKAISAVAAVFLLALTLTVVFNKVDKGSRTYATVNEALDVTLPDNSHIILNKNSTLTLARKFNTQNRSVEFSGEALFEISKNQQMPFVVHLEQGTLVKVLGTKFNLRSYLANPDLELNVLEGAVLFENDKNGVIVEKDEAISFNRSSNSFSKTRPLQSNLLAWHTKKFEFNNDPIKDVAFSLERFIHKSIILPNNVDDVRYSGTFDNPNENEIAEVLSLAMGWDYKITKESIVFKHKKATP